MTEETMCLGARDHRGTIILCADCKRYSPPLYHLPMWVAPAAKEIPAGKRAVVWSCVNKVKA